MVSVLFDGLRQEGELMQKYQDSAILEEVEIFLLAKSLVKTLKEAIKEQIEFESYWKRTYEQRPGVEYKTWKDYEVVNM